ncbi:hypothetical protein DL96DRAFT_1503731 [Flagelloscypha sp. PMI_526]|nr:hypothetical protein DL96DRAFT_1503731 [Flagelloscypha sp. PMI_526]
MHIILTGATGTIGAPVLVHCISSPLVTKLSVLTRRPFPLPPKPSPPLQTLGEHWDPNKVHLITHQDYMSYPEDVLDKLRGAEACIWAQGVGQFAVPKETYIQITHDYPLTAARIFPSLLPPNSQNPFAFIHVSGASASSDPSVRTKSMNLYAKTKSQAEHSLLQLTLPAPNPQLKVINVRPAYVDALSPSPTLTKSFVHKVVAPVLRTVSKDIVTPAGLLAGVLVDFAVGLGEGIKGEGIEDGGVTITNKAIRAWVVKSGNSP